MLKLKAIKFAFKTWAVVDFGNVKVGIQKASDNLLQSQNDIIVHGFSDSLFQK